MRPKFCIIMLLSCFSTTAPLLSGCDETLEFSNTAPGGLEITKDKCYLGPGDAVTLTGMATDSDGDEVSYSWTADTGTFTPADGIGQIVVWQAPGGHGTYRVVLNATDGIDDTNKGIDIDVGRSLDISHDVNVIDQTDYPYVVSNALPLYIIQGKTVRIGAGVSVIFSEGTGGFEVAGMLDVIGTEENRALLASSACPDERRTWKGLRYVGSQSGGTLSHLTMTHSVDGLTVEDGAVVTADNLIVVFTSGEGVAVKSGGSLYLSDSRIWDNGGGIYVANGMLQLLNSSIRDNEGYGMTMIANSGPFAVDVTGCVIAGNVLDGIVLAENANPIVNNCSMFWNGSGRSEYRVLYLAPGFGIPGSLNMRGNYWGVTTEIEIEQQILRNGSVVPVDYSGWLVDPPVQD